MCIGACFGGGVPTATTTATTITGATTITTTTVAIGAGGRGQVCGNACDTEVGVAAHKPDDVVQASVEPLPLCCAVELEV